MGKKQHTDEEVIQALREHGSNTKAAEALGINRRSMDRRLVGMKKRGWSPDHDMTHIVPDGYKLKGTSTLYGPEGEQKLQWVKSTQDEDRQHEIMEATIRALSEELPRVDPVQSPGPSNNKLANLYTLTDAHIGALAWNKEGGADWDLPIQESVLLGCFRQMVDNAPDASTCIISQLGDFLHFDGLESVTPRSGNLLDADSRFGKVVDTAIKMLRRIVSMALEKHEQVHLVIAEGNHDESGSIWLRKMFSVIYEDEPRVSVDVSELPYYVYQHGKVMLGFHHGHLKKNESLPLFFAAQFPNQWGSALYRYCHTGHRHHFNQHDHGGMTVTQHPTLGARDAHASRHGYISDRQAMSMTYHADYGFVGSNVVTPEMIEK